MKKDNSPNSVFDQIVSSVVLHLKQQGFSAVKANANGYATPLKVKWDEEHEGVVPDITGEHQGSVYVFDIETGDRINRNKAEDRWRLLSAFARRNNGKFYLIVPEKKASYVQEVAEDLKVQTEFLRLSGIE